GRELQSFGPTGAVHDGATRKRQPRPFRGLLNGIFARPVLHEIMPRKGLSPSDADRIDRMTRCQIDDNPLRILRVIFSGECLTQIRIAFPIRVCAAVRYARESVLVGAIVAGETTMRQKISERVPDKIARLRVPYKVPLAAGIAPCALRIPVPRFNKQFRILPVADRLPSRGEHLFDGGFGQEIVSRSSGTASHAVAERLSGNDGRYGRGGIDANRL